MQVLNKIFPNEQNEPYSLTHVVYYFLQGDLLSFMQDMDVKDQMHGSYRSHLGTKKASFGIFLHWIQPL